MSWTGTWGFVELVDAVVKSHADNTYACIHLNSASYWLVVTTPSVPVPAYACRADAAASMGLLSADQKPKYNHATDGQTDQSAVVKCGAVHVSGPVQSAALQPAAVATQYPSSGYYYDPKFGMTPLCIGPT